MALGGIHGESLTANQMPSATPVQDVFPRFDQRGTEIDGTVRSGSGMGLQLGANPFGEAWNRNATLGGGVRLATGTYAPFAVDLAFPAEVSWVVGRTYNARQDDGGHHDSDGYQGRNWFQTSQPELVLYDRSSPDDDILYLVYGADRYVEYVKQDADEYTGANGASGVVQFVAGAGGEPDTWVLHDPSGLIVTFFAEDVVSGSTYSVDGQLWKIEDQAGNVAYVGHATTASTAATSGYTTDGRITTAHDSAGRRFTYTYTTLDSVDRLTLVKAEINTGSWVEVGRAEYEYYGTANGTTYGGTGALMLATTMLPLSSTTTPGTESQSEVRKTYYRYWTGTFDADTNPGHPYALQYVVDAEGTRRFDWSDATFDEDFLSATESALKPYAAASFEYDASRRIDEVWFSGECGCAGGADGVHALSYTDAGGYSTEVGNTSYSASWMQRTVVDRPDTGWVSQYFDETGQALTRVLTDGDPAGSPSSTWVHAATRNSVGQVDVMYSPAASTGYTHSTGATTESTSVGLVRYYTYDSSSPYVTDVDWSTGYQAAAANRSRAEERDYNTLTETIGHESVTRPYLDYRYAYPNVVAASVADISDTAKTGTASESGSGPDLVLTTVTSTHPTVVTSENGSNAGNTAAVYRRDDGRVAFVSDEGGHFTYTRYADGLLVERIADADLTATYATGDDPNTDWGITEVSGGLAITTTYTYDDMGRMETTTMPDGRVTLVYRTRLADGRLVSLSVPKYEDLATDVFHGPVGYSVVNLAGKAEASGVIAFSGGTTTTGIASWIDTADDEPAEAVSTGTLSRLSTSIYDESGSRLEESRTYFLVPTGTPDWVGSDGTNYDATTYAYDDMGRRVRTADPTGTIGRASYDVRGNVTAVATGTDDTGLEGSPMAGTSNMVTTEARVYDGGSGGGNNHLTSVTRYIQGNTTGQRVTEYVHDTRGRVIVVKSPQSPHSVTAYDERGRVTATATYSSTSGLSASSVPTTATNRLSYATTAYDLFNRPYDVRNYRVNQSTGSVEQESSADVCIRTMTWYDAQGRVIKTQGSIVQKFEYDRLGRRVRVFTVAETDDSVYNDADDVSGDAVVEEVRTVYDDDTGLVLATGTIQRNFGSVGTGALDSNADADPLMWTAANISGRIQIASMWYDGLNRLTTTALYGTNHASSNAGDFDRDGLSAPGRSDTVLVTTRVYNDDGTLQSVTDPEDLETRYVYDAAHRQTAVISNYVNGTPSGATGDDDTFVRYTYVDGQRTEMWVDVDGDGTQDSEDQVTEYSYGVTTGGGSLVNSNHLLASTAYSDSSSGTDVVAHQYNAQGQRISTTDQIGDEMVFTYDTAGRQTAMAATLETSPASPTDDAILRIETAYDNRGMVSTVTSYDATSGGTVENQVKYSYDAWGNVTLIEQDRDSVVGGSGTGDYEVAFTYDEQGSTGVTSAFARIARTKVVYPNDDELIFDFGAAIDSLGSPTQVNFMMGRVEGASIDPAIGSTVVVAEYFYLGQGRVVRTDLPEPDMWSAVGASGGTYAGLDRFNRIVESSWTWDYTTGTDYNAYEVDLSYDRNSNITMALDQWHNGMDVLYTMDDLNRLTGAQRGDESSGSITLDTFHQEWTLDQTGNWDLFKNDLNGDNDWVDTNELNDDRTHNVANELTARDVDDDSTNDYSLTYTAAGQLSDDAQHYEYVYDAWGRLVKITDQSQATVTEYEYNGLGHRIGHRWDTDGNASLEWQWLAYDDKWRVVARFQDAAAVDAPFEQVYHHHAGLAGYGGSSYIDLVICRDRDTDTETSGLETREYVLQNWRADVVALAAADGDLLERVSYDPYGIPFGTHPTDLTTGATSGVAGYGMPDGSLGGNDYSYYLILYTASNWRADWDRDGDVDAADNTAYTNDKNAASGSWGRGVLSNRESILGYAGYVHEPATGAAGGGHGTMWHVRHRVLHSGLGRWVQRDPVEYSDGPSLYPYVSGSPLSYRDWTGLRREGGVCVSPCGCQVLPDFTPSCQPVPSPLPEPEACTDYTGPFAAFQCMRCCVQRNTVTWPAGNWQQLSACITTCANSYPGPLPPGPGQNDPVAPDPWQPAIPADPAIMTMDLCFHNPDRQCGITEDCALCCSAFAALRSSCVNGVASSESARCRELPPPDVDGCLAEVERRRQDGIDLSIQLEDECVERCRRTQLMPPGLGLDWE